MVPGIAVPQTAPAGLTATMPAAATRQVERAGPAPNGVVVTRHAMRLDGEEVRYTATAGMMPIRDEQGQARAEIFFVAYTRDDRPPEGRPIMFAFNGGPGAASIWLHLAAMGPKRVVLGEQGVSLPERFELVDNEYTWLAFSDLVFIDPVGTGFSRAAPGVQAKEFYGLKPDVQILAEFVREYITRYGRWLSPKYIAGESYGTTRAVALAGHLQNKVGMFFDGLILISAALDFQTLVFDESNDLPYIVFLPAYTATAWYHGKLPPGLQDRPLKSVLAEAEGWANVTYRLALAMGSDLDGEERERVIAEYARYTGLPARLVRSSNLRISNTQFTREILRDRGLLVGLLDGRVTGLPAGRESFITDPSLFITLGPLVATMYHYVQHDLQYQTSRTYEFLNVEVGNQWAWGSAVEGYPSVVSTLRQAMSSNTRLRVHMACGYYDLDTSYTSQTYSARHLLLDRHIRDHFEISYYHAGHQLYTLVPELEALTENIRRFVAGGMRNCRAVSAEGGRQ